MGTSIRGRDPATEEEFLGALYKGGELLAAGKVVEARSHLEKAQQMQPKHEKALNLLGLTYFKLGLFDRAADVYELLVRENPADPTLRVNLGLVYLKANDVQRSVKEFETATDLEPEHKKAHNYLGLALAQAGEYSKAREHFRVAGSDAMAEKMAKAMVSQAETAPHEPGMIVTSAPPATVEAIPVVSAPVEQPPPLPVVAAPPPSAPPAPPELSAAPAAAESAPTPVEDGDIEVMSDDELPSDEAAEQVGVEVPAPSPSSPINSDWGAQFGMDVPPRDDEMRLAADEGPQSGELPVLEATVEAASGEAQWTEPMPTPAPQQWTDQAPDAHPTDADQAWNAPAVAQEGSWDSPAAQAAWEGTTTEAQWTEAPVAEPPVAEQQWTEAAVAEPAAGEQQWTEAPVPEPAAGEQQWTEPPVTDQWVHSSDTGQQWAEPMPEPMPAEPIAAELVPVEPMPEPLPAESLPAESLPAAPEPEWITQAVAHAPVPSQPAWIAPDLTEAPADVLPEPVAELPPPKPSGELAGSSVDAPAPAAGGEATVEAEADPGWVTQPLSEVGNPVPTAEVYAPPSPPHVDISLTQQRVEPVTQPAAAAAGDEGVRAGYVAMGAQKLVELGASTRWMAEPPVGPFNIGPDGLALTVNGELLTRLTGLVAIVGSVDAKPENRRVRGRTTDQPFGVATSQLQRVSGTGVLYLEPGKSIFHAVDLDDEGAYLREERVFAFQEPVSFENGRLTAEGGLSLDLVHLKGNGRVLMQLEGPLKAMPLPIGAPMVVPLMRVVGWFGRVSPRLVGFAGQGAVELTGEGYALLGASERS